MKSLVIIIVLLYQHQTVNAGLLDDFLTRVNGFTTSIKNAFKSITVKYSTVSNSRSIKKVEDNDEDHFEFDVTKRNVEQLFNNFLKTLIEEAQTDSTNNSKIMFDPTAILSRPKLAARHGRPVESHVVFTKDGYKLTVHRLLSRHTTKQTNRTVLLHHGLLGSSIDWLLLGPEKSLPYILSDAGYDVWMANARGNYYSRGHVVFKVDSPEFWNFSWQQMGEHDLPAVIDYMRQEKQTNETINYVGHSMGATALLVLLSTVPMYNRYLRIGILLAPLAFMKETRGPLKGFSSMAMKQLEPVLNVVGNGEFLPSRRIPDRVASTYCYGLKVLCRNPLLFLSGSVPREYTIKLTDRFVTKLLNNVPAGGSTKTILHFAQLTKTGIFHMFDQINSEYPLNQVTLPIVLFSSDEDWLSTIPDVNKLSVKIANPVEHYILLDKNIKHTDFVWGPKADVLIFKKVLEFMDKGLQINLTKTNEIDAKTNKLYN